MPGTTRTPALPSQNSGRRGGDLPLPGGLRTSWMACWTAARVEATSRLVPWVMVTGRSVLGRAVMQGIPSTVVSSWSPPSRSAPGSSARPADGLEVSQRLHQPDTAPSGGQAEFGDPGAGPGMNREDDRHLLRQLLQGGQQLSQGLPGIDVGWTMQRDEGKRCPLTPNRSGISWPGPAPGDEAGYRP